MILEAAWASNSWFGHMAFWLGCLAALLTAFYSWRLIIMTFHGKPRADHHVMDHVHESPPVMIAPLLLLATGAVLAGFVFYGGFVGSAHHGNGHETGAGESVAHELEEESVAASEEQLGEKQKPEAAADADGFMWHKEAFWGDSLFVLDQNDTVEAAHGVPTWVKFFPVVMGVLGILLGYLAYMFSPGIPARVTNMFKPLHTLFYRKWYFDELYDRVFVKTSWKLGLGFWKAGDQALIDQFGPDGVTRLSQRIATLMSRFQTGFVYQYAFVMMIGMIGLVTWLAYKTGLIG